MLNLNNSSNLTIIEYEKMYRENSGDKNINNLLAI